MEVRVAIDTSRLTGLLRGDAGLAERPSVCEGVAVPLIVLGEMKAGFQGGNQRRRNVVLLQRFLAKATASVLPPGRETAEHYARLFVQLKRAGTPVPDNDL